MGKSRPSSNGGLNRQDARSEPGARCKSAPGPANLRHFKETLRAARRAGSARPTRNGRRVPGSAARACACRGSGARTGCPGRDRKSTRLNSSHDQISYAVFCLKKKKNEKTDRGPQKKKNLDYSA